MRPCKTASALAGGGGGGGGGGEDFGGGGGGGDSNDDKIEQALGFRTFFLKNVLPTVGQCSLTLGLHC